MALADDMVQAPVKSVDDRPSASPIRQGIVVAIDRTNRLATVQLATGLLISARWLGQMPAPRTLVRCEDIGGNVWACAPLGDSRQILHDDFTTLLNPAGTVWACDTAWTQYGTLGSVTGAGFGGYQGTVAITTPAVAGNHIGLRKLGGITYNTTHPEALWLSAQLHLSDYSQVSVIVGVDSDGSNDFSAIAGADAGVAMVITNNTATASVTPNLRTIKAGAATTTTGPVAAVSTFWIVDIVCNSLWAAMWVNGVGPVVTTSNLPSISEALNIALGVYPYTAAARALYVDWVHLERVSPVVQP